MKSQLVVLFIIPQANATAILTNCTIDGSRARAHPNCNGSDPSTAHLCPSELYIALGSTLLNLTFTNITSCHRNLILVNPDHAKKKIVIRGGEICQDGTLDNRHPGIEAIRVFMNAMDPDYDRDGPLIIVGTDLNVSRLLNLSPEVLKDRLAQAPHELRKSKLSKLVAEVRQLGDERGE